MARGLAVLGVVACLAGRANAVPLSKDAAGCQRALARGLARFERAKLKAWSRCLDDVLRGNACDAAARDAAIAVAVGKAKRTIATKCTDVLLFTTQPAGVGFAQSCQLEPAPLEPAEQSCAALAVTSTDQLADCLVCWKEAELDEWLRVVHPCLSAQVPAGSALACGTPPGGCPDPADTATVTCLRTIASAGTRWLGTKQKRLGACLNAVRAGTRTPPCPDPPTAAKLATAAQKAQRAIASKCPSLPPWWDVCPTDSTAPCDQTIASVADVGTCVVVGAAGAIVDELLCWQYPGASADGISCPSTSTTTSTTTTTSSTTTTTLPACGDGFVGGTEQCDPPCGGGCGAGQFCNAGCQCETATACACGTPDPTVLLLTSDVPGGPATGSVSPAKCFQGANANADCTTDADCSAPACVGGMEGGQPCPPSTCPGGGVCAAGLCRGHLDRGGLYFGGSFVGVPLPATVPDYGKNVFKTCCSGTTFTLAATSAAETGSDLECTSVGCKYGAPLPIPNSISPTTSTCVINSVAKNAVGSGVCTTGEIGMDIPLTAGIYLTGDILEKRCSGDSLGTFPGRVCLDDVNCRADPGDPGTCVDDPDLQPCPICNPTTGVCNGADNDGLPCTPGTLATPGVDFPTSHDCPPFASARVGTLPIPYALTTGTMSKTAVDLPQQPRVFCGFCRRPESPTFKRPAVACTSDADCASRAPFTMCGQRNSGAFGNALANTITETGAPSGDLTDHATHTGTLVSVYCTPPTFNAIVDPAADLPGPGAVSLPGIAQLQ